MGTWGPRLYQDDVAEDVRAYYKDQLHRGKSGPEITRELLKQNEYLLADPEEASVFWFALADTQWTLGRLEKLVKERALYYIHEGYGVKRWKEENPQIVKIREKVVSDLERKLLSPQPAEKKISQYKLYHCEWSIGDTFAYQLESDLAKEKGLLGRYFLIQKADETIWHPGHTVPIVYIKITKDKKLPVSMQEYNQLEYVQTSFTKFEDRFLPIDGKRPKEDIAEKSQIDYKVDEFGFLPHFRVILLSTSKNLIPANLTYIGNYAESVCPKNEFIPHSKMSIAALSWKKFEREMIHLYFGHNQRELVIYQKNNS